jgi:ATP-binding cassette subfamily F protein uup
VSHDRWFLERVCDVLWALPGDGTLRHLPGGVDDYLALRRAATAQPQAAAAGPGSPAKGAAGQARDARKVMQRIERRLERLGAEEQRLHDELAAHSTDYAKVSQLDEALRALQAERVALEEEWLGLAECLT